MNERGLFISDYFNMIDGLIRFIENIALKVGFCLFGKVFSHGLVIKMGCFYDPKVFYR